MNNYFEMILTDLKKLWYGLAFPQKLSLCALIIALVGALTFFIAKSTEPNWSVLYSDLAPNDIMAISESLKKNGYQYKISDDKTTILVPLNQKEDLRIFVAENDIITNSTPGFELLDKVQLGATDFQNKLTRQRIFQGELTKTIERINGVEKVRVQIAEPERSVFSNGEDEPSASVMLVLAPGFRLKVDQVKAIKNLVAYSIPRLKPDRVFVSDQNGEVLSEELNKSSNDITIYKANFEKNTAKKVTSVLEKIVGEENVSVEVSADMNFDSAKATIEKYIPQEGSNEGVLASTQTETETYDKGKKPQALAEGEDKKQTKAEKEEAKVNDKTINYEKERTSATYNVTKEVKQVIYAPGSINRMTVAIAINKILTEEEMNELKSLAMSAAGANEERGDIVKITSMQFTSFDDSKAAEAKFEQEVEFERTVNFWLTKVGPLAVVLILGLMALMIIKSFISKPFQGQLLHKENAIEDVSFDDFSQQEAELDKLAQESQKLLDVSALPKLEAKLAPEIEMMKSQLNNMILSNPSDASRLILSFIKD